MSGNTGTYATIGSAAVTLSSGDYLEIYAPSSADGFIGQGYGTLVGTR